MKIIRRLFIWFVILALAALGAFGFYLQVNGKQLAEENLSRIFKRPVHVGKAQVWFPLGLRLDDFEMEGILKSRSVDIQLRLPLILDKQLLVSKFTFVEPVIFISRNKEAQLTLPVPGTSPETPAVPPSSSAKAAPVIQGVFVDHLEIYKGKIQYHDDSLEKDYKIRLEDLDLKAADVSYPFKPVRSRCRFSVMILGEDIAFSGSKFQGEGWVNFADKDMDANLESVQPNAEKWLTVHLVSEKNDMTVEGKVDINQIMKTNHDTKDVSLQDFVFGALQSSGLQVGLEFMFKTQMDAFKVDKVSLSGAVRYQESGEGEGNSAFEENLKKIGEQLESLGSGPEENLNAVAPAPESAPAVPAANETVPDPAPEAAPQGTLAE